MTWHKVCLGAKIKSHLCRMPAAQKQKKWGRLVEYLTAWRINDRHVGAWPRPNGRRGLH